MHITYILPAILNVKQLNSLSLINILILIVEVAVDSIACGDRHIHSSSTEKAIAVSMNAWKCSCLDSWALRRMKLMEYGQLIANTDNRIRWIMIMMMMMMMIKY